MLHGKKPQNTQNYPWSKKVLYCQTSQKLKKSKAHYESPREEPWSMYIQLYLIMKLFFFNRTSYNYCLEWSLGHTGLELLSKLIYSLKDNNEWWGKCFITYKTLENKMTLGLKYSYDNSLDG